MSSDLRAALLRYKPEKHRARMAPRARGRLVGRHGYQPDRPADAGTRRQHLHHGGHTAEAARLLLERSLLFHCSVCLAELATGVANYNSAGPDWRRVRDYYTALFDTIPDSRILSPDDQAWIDAGVIAGSLPEFS
ncbi:hypothetical protein [Mesorhizobium sp. LNHC229A00]|uniref:hypothetical protein n=1 Tax=Mesorhizobium sp. LNHC229A00 TaxID=1287240 RepID=UPI001FD89346|nr:hypothetical protein [Mesorhizobium sp. LNHC229A00]